MKISKSTIEEAKKLGGGQFAVTKAEKEVMTDFILKLDDRGYANVTNDLEHKVAMILVDAGQATISKKKEYGKIAQIKAVRNESFDHKAAMDKALSNIDKQFNKPNSKPAETKKVVLKYKDGKEVEFSSEVGAQGELRHLEQALKEFEETNKKKGETEFRNKIIKKTEDRIKELKSFMKKQKW